MKKFFEQINALALNGNLTAAAITNFILSRIASQHAALEFLKKHSSVVITDGRAENDAPHAEIAQLGSTPIQPAVDATPEMTPPVETPGDATPENPTPTPVDTPSTNVPAPPAYTPTVFNINVMGRVDFIKTLKQRLDGAPDNAQIIIESTDGKGLQLIMRGKTECHTTFLASRNDYGERAFMPRIITPDNIGLMFDLGYKELKQFCDDTDDNRVTVLKITRNESLPGLKVDEAVFEFTSAPTVDDTAPIDAPAIQN